MGPVNVRPKLEGPAAAVAHCPAVLSRALSRMLLVWPVAWVTAAAPRVSAQQPAPTPAPAPTNAPPADPAAPAPANAQHGLGLLPAGSLDLAVTPDHVVLGKDARVTVELTARSPDGAALDVADLQLQCSTGAVERVEPLGPGRFRAAWRPPKQGFPHVAQLWAHARGRDGDLWGTATIPLWGQGQLTVETKPDAVVTLRLGDAAFGPVSANGRGVAVLSVVAPPGPTRAVAEVVDPAGNETKQTVDLGVPSFNRLAAFGPRHAVAGRTVTVAVMAVDRRGSPLPADTPLELDVQVGADPKVTPLRAGVWRVDLQAPPKVGPKPITLGVTLGGHKDSQAKVTIPVHAGPASKALVSLLPAQARAGARDQPNVTARVVDDFGNPARAPGLMATAVPGTLLEVQVDKDAVLRARWDVPPAFGDVTQGTLRVMDGSGKELAVTTLALRPAPAARITASTPRARDPASKAPDQFEVDVAAQDAFGNARPDTLFTLASPDGITVVSQSPNPNGSTRLLLHVPPRPVPGPAKATIQTDSGATVEVTLQAPRAVGPFLVVGGRAALAWNLGRLVLPGVGMDVTAGLPLALPLPFQLSLTATAHLGGHMATPLSFSLSKPLRTDRLLFTAPTSVTLGAQVQYRMFVLGGGVGGGVVFAHARVRQPGQSILALWGNLPRVPFTSLPNWGEAARLSSTAPALAGRLFGGVRLGWGMFYVDARLDAPLVLGTALTGFTGGPVLGAGYALVL